MAAKAQIARFLRGNSSDIKNQAIKSGNIILSKDSLELYIDTSDSERIRVSDVIYITDTERLGLLAPLPSKLYFTTDTNILYKYSYDDLEWKVLNPEVTKETLGLDQVDNTADADKRVAYAENSGMTNGHTVAVDVPADAVFTETTYE